MRALIIDDHPLIQEIVPRCSPRRSGRSQSPRKRRSRAASREPRPSSSPTSCCSTSGCRAARASRRCALPQEVSADAGGGAVRDRGPRLDPRRAGGRRARLHPEDLEARRHDRRAQAGRGRRHLRAARSARGTRSRRWRRAGGRRGSSTLPSASGTCCGSSSRATTTSALPPSLRSRRTRSSSMRTPSSWRSASRRAPRR